MGKTSLGSSLLYTWDMSCTNLVQWRLERDILSKRAGFIDQSVDIRETFGFASPAEVLRAVELYGGSHYGSDRGEDHYRGDEEEVERLSVLIDGLCVN